VVGTLKRRNILLTVGLVAVLVLSLFIATENFFLPDPQAAPPEFYVGVQCGYNNVTLCKGLIDKTKNYTNLFIIGATDIAKNSTLLNEVCDYAYDAGLHFSVYFSTVQSYTDLGENITNSYTFPNGTVMQTPSYRSPLPLAWINSSIAKYGDRFLGAYVFDEPGGNQLDEGTFRLVNSGQDYSSTATAFVQNVTSKIQSYLNSSAMIYTADYGLYWFDYQAGYDMVLADLGWNNSRPLQFALCRGAATAQNKDWGAMLTLKYGRDPNNVGSLNDQMGTGAELYSDLVSSYNNGAKCAVVFDYGETGLFPREPYQPYEYGILDEEHFDAMKDFWSYVQNNPGKHGSLKADVVLVLPEAYGFGFRSSEDNIWGLFNGDQWSQKMWSDVNSYLNEYGSRLNIVYDDASFTDAAKNSYNQVIYWSSGNGSDSFPVRNLNTTFGYQTIQQAICAGATSDGQVLSVKPGTYRENLVVNKTLSIVGDDKATTIIDGGNHGTAVSITQNGVKLEGFTVRNSGTNQGAGIYLNSVNNCNIANNNVEANYYGIYLNYSGSNTLRSNAMDGNVYNLGVDGNESSHFINDIDSSNTINGKKVYYLLNAGNFDFNPSTYPDVGYLALINCTGITVQGLNLSGNHNGLLLVGTQNSTITDNEVANCNEGVRLIGSQNNVLRNNRLSGNAYNFWVQNGLVNDADSSNTVNGKPIYYWVNQHDKTVPLDAGYVALINCTGITVQNLDLANNWQSIVLSSTTNSTIKQNQISNSYYGIVLEDASNYNSISANSVTSNVRGIAVSNCNSNSITGDTLSKNQYGAYFRSSNFTALSENTITANTDHGLQFSSGCNNNTLTGNQINNNSIGVEFIDSSSNSIIQNNLANNNRSIQIHGSSSYTNIAENAIANSSCGVEIALDNVISDDYPQYGGSGYTSYSSSIDIYMPPPVTSSHSVTRNILVNNERGILINSANDTNIADNTITGGDYGIALGATFGWIMNYGPMVQTQNDTLKGNTITNSNTGIYLASSNNCSIVENNITKGMNGISLSYSTYNSVVGNVLANMGGIQLTSSSYGNLLKRNSITANTSGFGDDSIDYGTGNVYYSITTGEILSKLQYFVNDVDNSNTLNGKPIYYWVGQSDKTVPSDAACAILVNCTNITVQNLNLTGNFDGIQLVYTHNSTILGNNIQNNTRGIRLLCSSYNTITGNNIVSNGEGIKIEQKSVEGFDPISGTPTTVTVYPSTGNVITGNNLTSNSYGVSIGNNYYGPGTSNEVSGNTYYHNNFINNQNQVNPPSQSSDQPSTANNSWDNGVEGNYWSDYNGTDANHDGIGDSPYQIKARSYNREGGIVYLVVGEDRFPLMHPFSVVTKTQG
jgi:parallel beta-helix repeat protein